MSLLLAKVKRHLHCLFNLHRAETIHINYEVVFIGCRDCGKAYYSKGNKTIDEQLDTFYEHLKEHYR